MNVRQITQGMLAGALLSLPAWGATVHGKITKIDSTAKTIVVKTADGTEHTLHFVGKTMVHGGEAVAAGTKAGAKDAFHGLKEGTEVVANYTAKGSEETATEVDRVGADAMKKLDGTVTKVDHGAKTVAVKTADGTEQTVHLTDAAVKESGKGIEKSAKVSVYYTEEAGKKIAHIFEH